MLKEVLFTLVQLLKSGLLNIQREQIYRFGQFTCLQYVWHQLWNHMQVSQEYIRCMKKGCNSLCRFLINLNYHFGGYMIVCSQSLVGSAAVLFH